MTVKCPNCQTENPDAEKFCGECGAHFNPVDSKTDVTKIREMPAQKLTRGSVFAN